VALTQSPRDEVAVGWPARASQVAYSLVPRGTEHLVGALARRALRRARPAPRSEGALLRPTWAGTGVSGGWRERKGVPSGRASSGLELAVAVAGAALVLGTKATAFSRRP
jgi:hypothetical protein